MQRNHQQPENTPSIEVLIVGAGPVGLTLAIDLASRGIACRLIDKTTSYAIGSRARGVSPRTQEIFEDLGVLKSLSTSAAPCLPMRLFDVFLGAHFTQLSFGDESAPCLPHHYHTDVQTYSVNCSGNLNNSNNYMLFDRDEYARRAYGIKDNTLILVRPDGYVDLTVGGNNPQPVLDYLCQIMGR